MVAGGTEEQVRWSSLAKAQAQELGIDVQVETLEAAALTARLNSADYDLFRFGYDTVDPDILAFFFYASQIPQAGGAGLNRSRVNDPELEARLTKQRNTLGEERRTAVEECVRYMMDQAIFLPLYSPEKHTVVSKEVKGVIFYPDAADWELTEAWIDQ
jgi:peptide/nickel transport system substrate-binding protein